MSISQASEIRVLFADYHSMRLIDGRIQGTTYKIVTQNEDQIELSFVRNGSALTDQTAVPLNIDKRCGRSFQREHKDYGI